MASTGVTYATVGVNDSTSPGGGLNWINPQLGCAYAPGIDQAEWSAGATTNAYSKYLRATGFGFNIPSGSTIDGIVIATTRFNLNAATTNTYDYVFRILKGGNIGATDRSDAGLWTNSWVTVNHGTSTDLWGETWTAADINSSTFGVAISSTTSAAYAAGSAISGISATIYYTPPQLPSVNDAITVSESVNLSIVSHISVSDSISVTDVPSNSLPTLFLSANDQITVTEAASNSILNFAEISRVENVSVSEYIKIVIPTEFISAFEAISVSESISISASSLIVQLLISESVTVTDSVSPTSIYHLVVYENISAIDKYVFDITSAPGYNMPGSRPRGTSLVWDKTTFGGGL
jgi:hypothetical protein